MDNARSEQCFAHPSVINSNPDASACSEEEKIILKVPFYTETEFKTMDIAKNTVILY